MTQTGPGVNGGQTYIPAHEKENPSVGWKGRVKFSHRAGVTVAHRPNEIFCERPEQAKNWMIEKSRQRQSWRGRAERIEIDTSLPGMALMKSVPDELAVVDELKHQGYKIQLNHVFFTHCGCCPPHPAFLPGGGLLPFPAYANPAYANPAYANPAYANPAYANPAYTNPAYANPAYANPAYANPAYANPAYANPAYANPAYANPALAKGLRRSSARPATLEEQQEKALVMSMTKPPDPHAPKIIVLDTGLAGVKAPDVLAGAIEAHSILGAEGAVLDQPDSDENDILDAAAGHGMFISGLVNSVCPGCRVTVHRVLRTYGDGDEATIVRCIEGLERDDRTILNLSFGGYVWEEPLPLARAIKRFQDDGGVVVSSAGNDATCQPSLPAALPDVVSVGAIGATGPAPFTNYGPWVRACAPGVNLVSMFFNGFEGAGLPSTDGIDPDNFEGWAEWSGTSFAAPVVAAALGRTMTMMNCSAKEAVERVIDHPSLMRIPFLGTVVNII
jgi:hypothetical protein